MILLVTGAFPKSRNVFFLAVALFLQDIGKGEIGLTAFQLLLNDPRFCDHPMTFETPKGKDLAEDRENIALLRSLCQ